MFNLSRSFTFICKGPRGKFEQGHVYPEKLYSFKKQCAANQLIFRSSRLVLFKQNILVIKPLDLSETSPDKIAGKEEK